MTFHFLFNLLELQSQLACLSCFFSEPHILDDIEPITITIYSFSLCCFQFASSKASILLTIVQLPPFIQDCLSFLHHFPLPEFLQSLAALPTSHYILRFLPQNASTFEKCLNILKLESIAVNSFPLTVFKSYPIHFLECVIFYNIC